MPFRRDRNERQEEEITLADTKRAVPAYQDKRAEEEIVAPRQFPESSQRHCRRQVSIARVM